jgi:hypothetical protein
MALYRCYCRNALNQITDRHDIIAPDLEAALREARWLCRGDSMEIWQGILRIYPPDPDRPGARE